MTVNDSAEADLRGLRIFGKSTQDGTPSPDAPVPIVSVGDDGAINMSITETAQTLAVSTPNGLPGIPVISGGNYTDADGQQWVCDEVDFERGVYVHRVYCYTLTGSEHWTSNNNGLHSMSLVEESLPRADAKFRFNLICTILAQPQNSSLNGDNIIYIESALVYVRFKTLIPSLNELINVISTLYSDGSPAEFLYVLATPIETPLTTEQLTAYRALRTQYPTTNVNNDEGAGMEITYVADTKSYIDKKFAELSAAILNA